MSRTRLSEHASAIDTLDFDVREEVRRRGLDPLTDVEAVRRFALSAVRAHDVRSLTGVVRPVENPEEVVDELVARVAGFGPLQRYLDDPTVEEVWINEPQRVFVARDGRHELTTTILTAVEVRDLVERMLKTSGRRLDLSTPFVDAMLPSGHRLHVVLDGISRGFSAVNIRKFVVRRIPAADLGLCAQRTCSVREKSAGESMLGSGQSWLPRADKPFSRSSRSITGKISTRALNSENNGSLIAGSWDGSSIWKIMNAVRFPSSGPKYAASGLSFSIIDCMTVGMRPSWIALLAAAVSI